MSAILGEFYLTVKMAKTEFSNVFFPTMEKGLHVSKNCNKIERISRKNQH